nr:hypothetical protein [Pandoravirus massiliensis]
MSGSPAHRCERTRTSRRAAPTRDAKSARTQKKRGGARATVGENAASAHARLGDRPEKGKEGGGPVPGACALSCGAPAFRALPLFLFFSCHKHHASLFFWFFDLFVVATRGLFLSGPHVPFLGTAFCMFSLHFL